MPDVELPIDTNFSPLASLSSPSSLSISLSRSLSISLDLSLSLGHIMANHGRCPAATTSTMAEKSLESSLERSALPRRRANAFVLSNLVRTLTNHVDSWWTKWCPKMRQMPEAVSLSAWPSSVCGGCLCLCTPTHTLQHGNQSTTRSARKRRRSITKTHHDIQFAIGLVRQSPFA